MHYPFIFEEINIFLNISEFAVFVLHIKLCFISRKSNMLQNVASLKQKKKEKWLWLKLYPSQVFLFPASNSNHDLLKRNIFFP